MVLARQCLDRAGDEGALFGRSRSWRGELIILPLHETAGRLDEALYSRPEEVMTLSLQAEKTRTMNC